MSDAFDRWLDLAGFDPNPDGRLSGRAAEELTAAADPSDLGDPWADAVESPAALSAGQRQWVSDTSPAFGAALPGASLTGDAPFAGLQAAEVDEADRAVIDFDEPED